MTSLACEGAEREVTVRVVIPDVEGQPTPASGVAVVAAPFDRDDILRRLEAGHPPRPHTTALDSLFDAYREPLVAFFRATQARRAAADSPPEALARREREVEAARARLDAMRLRLDPVIESLRADVRSWENSTYRGYDTLARSVREGTGRDLHRDTTDADGTVTFSLQVGTPWWITASSWDPSDPNRLWYWNEPADTDTVLLDATTGTRRNRY